MHFNHPTTFLVVVAHPDDEVLGFGASAHALTQAGHTVHTAIAVGDAEARTNRPATDELHHDTDRAHEIVGMQPPTRGTFPNIKLNTVPHLDLVQFVEAAIRDVEPDIVVSLHPGDINDDHQQLSRACQAAARLPQRNPAVKRIDALLFMEVPSSTDWAIHPAGGGFAPNVYLEVDPNSLDAKIASLQTYRGVMRPHPHPRSVETINALATVRGSEAGLHLAEAFEVGFFHLGA